VDGERGTPGVDPVDLDVERQVMSWRMNSNCGLPKSGRCSAGGGEEVVDAQDLVSTRQQPLAEVRSDEPAPPVTSTRFIPPLVPPNFHSFRFRDVPVPGSEFRADGEALRGEDPAALAGGRKTASSRSASTMIRTSSLNVTFGSQPSSFFAFEASAIRFTTSVGRKYFGSIFTCSFQSRPA